MAAEVIQPREDALFGDPEASCHDGFFQIVRILETAAQHLPYDVDHVVVIAAGTGFVERHVVFVQQHDDRMAKHCVKSEDDRSQRRFAFLFFDGSREVGEIPQRGHFAALELGELFGRGEESILLYAGRKRRGKTRQCVFKRVAAHVLKGQRKHRPTAEIGFTERRVFFDGQSLKKRLSLGAVVGRCKVKCKETLQHALRQRLSETPRPCDERDVVAVFVDLTDVGRFIDEVRTAFPHAFEGSIAEDEEFVGHGLRAFLKFSLHRVLRPPSFGQQAGEVC